MCTIIVFEERYFIFVRARNRVKDVCGEGGGGKMFYLAFIFFPLNITKVHVMLELILSATFTDNACLVVICYYHLS